jgi:hypothetical protein
MPEALHSLEVLCAAPSQAVERSEAVQISVVFPVSAKEFVLDRWCAATAATPHAGIGDVAVRGPDSPA